MELSYGGGSGKVAVTDRNSVRRDRWGRPEIELPGQPGVTAPYMRASGVWAGDDAKSLVDWAKSMTLKGAGMNPHLPEAASMLDYYSSDDGEKRKLVALADQAFSQGGGKRAAENGTLGHAAVDHLLGGGKALASWSRDTLVTANACMRAFEKWGWVPTLREQFVCVDAPGFASDGMRQPYGGVAGSFDQLGSFDLGRLADALRAERPEAVGLVEELSGSVIGDLKMGSEVKYSSVKFACQGYVYACGRTPLAGGGREELAPDMNRRWMVIWHAPYGKGWCEPRFLSLSKAPELIRLSGQLISARRSKLWA